MRVDSPGGSAFASELIREQLELTRKAGKPVVVSMGDVAASGGYWIAMGGDEVIADAATITGSIGVFALIPNFTGTMEKVGVHTAGVRHHVDRRGDRPDAAARQAPGAGGRGEHRPHVPRIPRGRRRRTARSTPEKINEVAQGRVWTGAQAKERGLVDSVGGLDLAVKSAARRASLGDDFRVEYLEHEPRGLDRYLSLFFGRLGAALRDDFGWDALARALIDTLAPRRHANSPCCCRRRIGRRGRCRTASATCAELIAR